MDVTTFYQNNFQVVRQIKETCPHIRILVLSGLEDNYVYPVKQISYLPFDASSTALVEAIRQAYQGKGFPFPATATDSMIH
jgi:DNA-binding NarL/FixJ family response regulator